MFLYSFVPNAVTLNPPLLLTDEDLSFALDVLDQALFELDALIEGDG